MSELLFVIFGVSGLICLAVTYAALYVSRRKGRYVSGCPCVGGVLIILAFLTTEYKWLAVLGFADYGLSYLVLCGIKTLAGKIFRKT